MDTLAPTEVDAFLADLVTKGEVISQVAKVIRKAHCSDKPALTAYSIRQVGSSIVEVAQWLNVGKRKRYAVITWHTFSSIVDHQSFIRLEHAMTEAARVDSRTILERGRHTHERRAV